VAVGSTPQEGPGGEEVPEEDRHLKATKSDNAPVPIELWNSRVEQQLSDKSKEVDWIPAADIIRQMLLKRWKMNQLRSWRIWKAQQKAAGEAVEWESYAAAADCFKRIRRADFWEWSGGSRPFFWKWPPDLQLPIRDGTKLWMEGKLTPWKEPQRGATS
jgi:hypothetical protein